MTDILSSMAIMGAGNCHPTVGNLHKTGPGDPCPGMVARVPMESPATGHGVAGGSHRFVGTTMSAHTAFTNL